MVQNETQEINIEKESSNDVKTVRDILLEVIQGPETQIYIGDNVGSRD